MPKRVLDDQERKIVRALIKNPRASDNIISKQTGVPVMSVNRKRKKLESDQLLQYFAAINTDESGLGVFESKQLYILKLKAGLTQNDYLNSIERDAKFRIFNTRFVSESYIGERNGQLALIIILNAPTNAMMNEEFNGRIVPYVQSKLGAHAIESIETVPLSSQIRILHNYMPQINMTNGVIKAEWPDEYIFVDDSSLGPHSHDTFK
ncbi:MAG TPA: Lrp/AsnC family transcriptional regulator [Acidobacteriota bacterium]|nr:Lrp/AsnC family transcriptional regulator [Acidobacteriota bacterium]